MADESPGRPDERLVSWKRIAQYLQCSERTARRWAAGEGLPVQRHTNGPQGSVFAWRSELDAWLKARPGNGSGGESGASAQDSGGEPPVPPAPAGRAGLFAPYRIVIAAALLAGLALAWLLAAGLSGTQESAVAAISPPRIALEPFRAAGTRGELTPAVESLQAKISAVLSANGIKTVAPVREGSGTPPEFLLKGAVMRDADRYRVTVHLHHRASGANVWSRTFSRRTADLAALPDHVAALTARALACAFAFSGDETVVPPEIFADFMRYCATERSYGNIETLPALSRQLLDANPTSTTARAIHGISLAVSYGSRKVSPQDLKEAWACARTLSHEVLAVQPENRLALLTQALILPRRENWAEIERLLLKAEAAGVPGRRPGLENWWRINLFRARLLRQTGRLEEAAALYESAVAANPFDVFARVGLAGLYVAAGLDETARRHLDRAERENPDWREIHQRRLDLELLHGNAGAAIALLRGSGSEPLRLDDERRACYETFARVRMNSDGIPAVAAACAAIEPHRRAHMFAILGDMDSAYGAAEDLDPEYADAAAVFFQRGMEAFRRDPRFFPLAANFGLVDYWLETDKWPDFCREKALPFDCRERARAAAERTEAAGPDSAVADKSDGPRAPAE